MSQIATSIIEGRVVLNRFVLRKHAYRATELGFLDSSDREKVRNRCLTDGEYMFGSEETPGWMIGQKI